MIKVPNGIILVTGATGSGKSTTVYSILQKMNTDDVNIITVEDPVEMDILGINQVQAQAEIGLTFATVLRSILRQDPDIIMIGEIRDDETARIAVRASITGHKVLSTIHTNNSLNTIERLTDMEVERYLLGTALEGIISQKLARRICEHCRILRKTNDYEKDVFKRVFNKDVDEIYDANPDGCEHCFRGYSGRIGLYEVLNINDDIRDAITNNIKKTELRKLVYDGNTITLLEDGLQKVLDGFTSFSEILKAVDLENDLETYEEDNLKTSMDTIEENKHSEEVITKKEITEIKDDDEKLNDTGNELKTNDLNTSDEEPIIDSDIQTIDTVENITPVNDQAEYSFEIPKIEKVDDIPPAPIMSETPKQDLEYFNF